MLRIIKKYMGGYDNTDKRRSTISIYRGGKEYKRSVGEETEFGIRDILICLKYIKLSDFDSKSNKKEKKNRILKSIHDTFMLSKAQCVCSCSLYSPKRIFNEIDYLVNLPDDQFAQIYSRRFRLYFSFSDSLCNLFSQIKRYYENNIKLLCKRLDVDISPYIKKWKEADNNEHINSSSIILYQLGKDSKFLNEITTINRTDQEIQEAMNKFKKYVSNSEKWSYIGWCSYVPVIRMNHLLEFPLDMVFDILKLLETTENNSENYVDDQIKLISDLNLEKEFKNVQLPHELYAPNRLLNVTKCPAQPNITSKIAQSKIKKMILKLNKVKPTLIKWEDYYIEHAKIYSIISNKFNIIQK